METLRTQIDNLQWEVNCLDAENRKLRSQDESASRCVDLEAELERAREDGEMLSRRVETLERERAKSESASERVAHQVAEAEEKIAGLEKTVSEQEAAHRTELEEATADTHEKLAESERNLEGLTSELAERECELQELRDRGDHEREAMMQKWSVIGR